MASDSKPMKKAFLVFAVLIIASSAIFSDDGISAKSGTSEILKSLSSGNQEGAETKLKEALEHNPRDHTFVFLAAVCERSRFDQKGAAAGFSKTMASRPDSPEGLASACVLGIDMSKDQGTALYYFNALLIVSRQNPRSIPLRWLVAIMARSITRDSNFQLTSEVRKRILECGIHEYEAVLALMAPGPGPVLIHQTMGNLLDDVEGYDASLRHREVALKMERAPWSLHAAAWTLLQLGRYQEALAFVKEAISMKTNRPEYYWVMGDASWNLGHWQEAIGAWEKASFFDSDDQLYYFKRCANGWRSLGNYAAAKECTHKALVKDPGNRYFQIWDARLAAILGEREAGERVLQAGSFDFKGNPSKLNKSSDPWFLAVETGDLGKIAQMLGSVDINARDPDDSHQTALMAAACYGWEQIAAELIRSGAKLDLVDDNGDTALHYSAEFGQPRVMKLLLDAGANPNLQDKWKQTPLIMCATEKDWDGFSLLMEKKADVNLATPHGGTALHYAAGHGDLSMVNNLIGHGANVNQPGEKLGSPPLITACRDWAHSYIVGPLLAAGADLNARDKDGRTALHHAVCPLLNIPLVELLLEKGANPALADNNGVTPITQARLLGFEEVARQMEKKAGRPELFRFPQFESPDKSVSTEEQNAALYVLPILLAQGHPLGRPSGVPAGDKRQARKELTWMFGIENAAQLKEELQALEAFEPRYRENAGNLSSEISSAKANGMCMAAAKKIHASCSKGTVDEMAWVKSHVIYLADLGVSAGFLDAAEGDQLISNASAVLKGKYSSWPAYVRSFLLGAQFHCGWEADRYKNICDRLLEARLRWPAASVADTRS